MVAGEKVTPSEPDTHHSNKEPKPNHSIRWNFWLTLASVCLMTFVASIGSSIATSLPKISNELESGASYIWIACSYMLAQTAIQPPCAQMCNIFGRRNPMVISVIVYAAGSAVAGSSKTSATLIGGRTIQGLASGCIMMLSELIVCDLVPLRERGKYVGFVLAAIAFGTVVGPITSGALAENHWRWIFYMNLPICGVVLASLLFVRLRHKREPSWAKALSRIDWIGNILFIGSASAIMIGIISAGSTQSWSSWRTIVPIISGAVGYMLMPFFEASSWCPEPTIPLRLFNNRTSVAGYLMTFLSSILIQWAGFFWPVYFQMRGSSTFVSAINLLPFLLCLMPVAAISGILLSKFGRYRLLHALGFVLTTVGLALNTLLTSTTPTVTWTVLQMVNTAGQGLILPTLLPSIMASILESDAATATGVFSFLRSFGYVWGIVLSSIIFDDRFSKNSWLIHDPGVRKQFHGSAYESIGRNFLSSLPEQAAMEVSHVYVIALRSIWIGASVVGCIGALCVAFEKHVPLRKSLETEYGLDADKKKSENQQNGVDGGTEEKTVA